MEMVELEVEADRQEMLSAPGLKVIYIAGPYRAPTEFGVVQNIRAAEEAALFVWRNGGVALCPQKNTALFGGAYGLDDLVWLHGDQELLRRCDAVYFVAGWELSVGCRAERTFAERLGIPILTSFIGVLDFLGMEMPED